MEYSGVTRETQYRHLSTDIPWKDKHEHPNRSPLRLHLTRVQQSQSSDFRGSQTHVDLHIPRVRSTPSPPGSRVSQFGSCTEERERRVGSCRLEPIGMWIVSVWSLESENIGMCLTMDTTLLRGGCCPVVSR